MNITNYTCIVASAVILFIVAGCSKTDSTAKTDAAESAITEKVEAKEETNDAAAEKVVEERILKTEGDWCYYEIDGGKGIAIAKCANSKGDLSIPSEINGKPVISIGREAFCECEELTSVIIPQGVTCIETNAFASCANLQSVKIPAGMKKIEGFAFCGCPALSSISLPASVTMIEDCAFCTCNGLRKITLEVGNANYRIINDLLCTKDMSTVILGINIEKISIPPCVTKINKSAFSECDQIKSLSIPEGVADIGDGAFAGCNGLTEITIPASMTNIGDEAFVWCYNLKKFTVDHNNPKYSSINGMLCTKDGSTLITGVNVENITIPNCVKHIQACAFNCFYSIKSVKIPSGVESIGEWAFNGCEILSMTIPSTVTNIGARAFTLCNRLGTISLEDGNKSYCITNNMLCTTDGTEVIMGNHSNTAVIPQGVTKIDDGAFYCYEELTSITIPPSVKSIGEVAFGGGPESGRTYYVAKGDADRIRKLLVSSDDESVEYTIEESADVPAAK